ncbi:MAG: DUF1801 domain-containing protein [Chitinophagales bacterium]|nr:DUF1801 domain-containing protein [Chitinophagales bacterium]HMV14783.1 DUF1801 domain-containing protein [Chitinophagales bacterium]HMW13646.1 DUF1801 domain-containing protein [Chitinophagales bacterium]HMX61031.1 DUF1801 domain-containing protein [Chitinophagales bacterium]HMY24291.1 DUF1801 domain-containing protein [Chitinophagales bacterium]
MKKLDASIVIYNSMLSDSEQEVANVLANKINQLLPNAKQKIWHSHPVWFINDNPIVGYSKQKLGIRLMFWSGADFVQHKFTVIGKKFKDASIFYKTLSEINYSDLENWILQAKAIQWDYKNIVKRKGLLLRLL